MGKIVKVQLKQQFLQVPNETARRPENDISLQALGLLTNIMSYPETWELRKTELYKRYKKNKETSVSNAWKELVEHGFIIECKIRDGKKWDYNYYIRLVPFTEEEKEQIRNDVQSQIDDGTSIFWTLENQVPKKSDVSTLDFQDPKMRTSKSRDNKKGTKEKQTKEINTSTYVGSDSSRHSVVFDRFVEGYQLTNYAKQQLSILVDTYDETLVLEALNRAISNEAQKPIAYIKGILNKWRKSGVTSLNDIKDYEEEHKRNKVRSTKNKKPTQQKRPTKDLPAAAPEIAATVDMPKQMTDDELKKRQEQIKAKLAKMREQQKKIWAGEENR